MSLDAQKDRLVAAFTAGGVNTQWIRGQNVPNKAAWMENVKANRDGGLGGARNLIYDVALNTSDPLVQKNCGTLVIGFNCGFAALRASPNAAQAALEVWIAEIYSTAGGAIGKPSGWPIVYPLPAVAASVTFVKFEPVGGLIPDSPREYAPGTGLWVADCAMQMVFMTS